MSDATNEPLLQFFGYSHLPPAMQAVSKPFHDLAHSLVSTLPRNPERTVAMRKLLEAKDCAVRAAIYKQEAAAEPTTATVDKPLWNADAALLAYVNSATRSSLLDEVHLSMPAVNGIAKWLANHGPFKEAYDIGRAAGVGPVTMRKLRRHVIRSAK